MPPDHLYSSGFREVIVTTEDRLWLKIMEYTGDIEARKAWIAPVGVFLVLVAALCTATFKDALWLHAGVWRAVFVLAASVSAIWSAAAVVGAVKSRNVENLVDAVKRSAHIDTDITIR